MSREKFQNVDIVFDRLKDTLKIEKDVDFAEFLGIKPGKLGVWRSRNYIPFEMLISVCKANNIDIHWLLTGQATPPGREELWQGLEMVQERREDYNDYVYVPRMSGDISAGGGMVADNTIEMRIAFRRDWIGRRGDPEKMSLIRVSGDSMEPTLQSGDLVLVDHGRNYLDPQGGIYAISIDNQIMIKRLQLIHTAGRVKIISDNARYESIEADLTQVKINGKVIWFGREVER